MKHKHYDCIVAWAEGKEIQCKQAVTGNWFTLTGNPKWEIDSEYRIKPEPKPDVFTYLTVSLGYTGQQTLNQYKSDNIKFIYCGETGKLKSVEVI